MCKIDKMYGKDRLDVGAVGIGHAPGDFENVYIIQS